MKKTVDFLTHPISFPVLILGIIYIVWLFTAPMDFDGNFSNYFAGLILFGMYILITVLAKAASANWKFTLGFIILSIPSIFCMIIYAAVVISALQMFGWPRSRVVFITASLPAVIYPIVTLLSTLTSKNGKISLILFFSMIPMLEASILYPLHFYPKTLDTAKLGNYKYYVVISPDWDGHYFQTFYRCGQFRFGCRHLYSSYSESIGKLVVDEQKKEVSLLGFIGLLHTDGENPRGYSQPAVEFEDHIYQFWDICNDFNIERGYYSCESYTYILHECNLDYIYCNPLPIQYTTESLDGVLRILGNETSKEIDVYIDYPEDGGIPIFTYGEHPRCYVAGCEILEENK